MSCSTIWRPTTGTRSRRTSGGSFTSGGSNGPEASDEALNTAINGLDEADRGPGQQVGDFDGVWRDKSVKIIVLITDAPPAGFDDQFTPGVDDVNAHARAVEAAAAGIKLSAVFVPTSGNYSGQVAIMQDYAATTGGLYLETAPDGAGTAAAIDEIILSCGGSCGDGVLDAGESCDDGNELGGDGCDIYCRQSFTCPVLPPDSCLASLETCTLPEEPALTVPVCTWEVIGTGDGCDCGCGFTDPDCEGGGCTERGCTAPDCVACTDACGRWTPCPSEPRCPAPPAEVPDRDTAELATARVDLQPVVVGIGRRVRLLLRLARSGLRLDGDLRRRGVRAVLRQRPLRHGGVPLDVPRGLRSATTVHRVSRHVRPLRRQGNDEHDA